MYTYNHEEAFKLMNDHAIAMVTMQTDLVFTMQRGRDRMYFYRGDEECGVAPTDLMWIKRGDLPHVGDFLKIREGTKVSSSVRYYEVRAASWATGLWWLSEVSDGVSIEQQALTMAELIEDAHLITYVTDHEVIFLKAGRLPNTNHAHDLYIHPGTKVMKNYEDLESVNHDYQLVCFAEHRQDL